MELTQHHYGHVDLVELPPRLIMANAPAGLVHPAQTLILDAGRTGTFTVPISIELSDDLYRRSLYIFWRRSVGPTMLFDVSARQVCTVKQSRTNTPLHALTLMNDITYVEASRHFAERMLAEGGSRIEDQITGIAGDANDPTE